MQDEVPEMRVALLRRRVCKEPMIYFLRWFLERCGMLQYELAAVGLVELKGLDPIQTAPDVPVRKIRRLKISRIPVHILIHSSMYSIVQEIDG